MKPIIQILPLQDNESFAVRTVGSDYFDTGRHRHMEYELILFTEGAGHAFIDKQDRIFEPGDVFLLGSNLPHAFQKNGDGHISAVVVQFKDGCWGKDFLSVPECRPIKQLLESAGYGFMPAGNSKKRLQRLIRQLGSATGGDRIILLLQCLQLMAVTKEFLILAPLEMLTSNHKDKEWIDKISKYTNDTFRDSISLPQVAAVACMSVPSFCHYFKRRTQRTYIGFLNEVRVSYACSQLLETDKPVTDICYDSGYNTVAHFHRQFMRLKKTTPLQYRKVVSPENTRYQLMLNM